MWQFLITWLATAVSLIVTAFVVPGFAVVSFTSALIGAAVLGLVNAVVKPILILFTLSLTILTLGLFLLVVKCDRFRSGKLSYTWINHHRVLPRCIWLDCFDFRFGSDRLGFSQCQFNLLGK